MKANPSLCLGMIWAISCIYWHQSTPLFAARASMGALHTLEVVRELLKQCIIDKVSTTTFRSVLRFACVPPDYCSALSSPAGWSTTASSGNRPSCHQLNYQLNDIMLNLSPLGCCKPSQASLR